MGLFYPAARLFYLVFVASFAHLCRRIPMLIVISLATSQPAQALDAVHLQGWAASGLLIIFVIGLPHRRANALWDISFC